MVQTLLLTSAGIVPEIRDYFLSILPKKKPEENPTEQCWKPGRNALANRVIPSLNAAKYHLQKTFNDTKAIPKMFYYLRD